ncbi:hypothetical protein Tco_1358053, partial [Tanacetum coccineum]
ANDESMEAARLRTQVSSLEAIEGSLRGEFASAKEHNGLLEQERSALKLKVTSLESIIAEKDRELFDLGTSASSLRLAEIDADFTRCCMHFQENFHPHLLNAIAGQRWLLRRCLSDLEAYNPSAEADFNFAVHDLRGLDFSLLQELSAKKDASTWDVIDLLRLDDAVAEVLGMTDLQPDVGQLMLPVHHKQDKVMIGSQVLSIALETCHRRVRKMKRNLAECLPLLKDVFVSIHHPVSTEALAILSETSTEPPVTALITTALSTVVIHLNSDPFLLVKDYENPDLAGVVPEDFIPGPKGEGKVEGSTKGDVDDVFSQFENEARDVVP